MLYILTPIFCVALCVGAVFSFLNNNKVSANAAVAKNSVVYTAKDQLQYYHVPEKVNLNPTPYSVLGPVNTAYGDVSFDGGSKTAVITKNNIGYHYLAGYISFSAAITVPAYTEYKVTFSADMGLYRKSIPTGGSATGAAEFFYYGYSDTSSVDKSSDMIFSPSLASVSTPAGYTIKRIITTEEKQFNESCSIDPITYSNTTNAAVTYTAYFGFFASCTAGTSYAGSIDTSLAMKDKVEITPIAAPKVDKTTEDYVSTGSTFNFTYDRDRIILSSIKFTDPSGAETDVKSLYPIDSAGNCTLVNAGTYKFNFDIAPACGAVWNSTTNDQSTKTLTITIKQKVIDKPQPDLETTYNNASQSLSTLAAGASWYDNTLYSDSTLLSVSQTTFTEANESGYTVSVQILSPNYAWSDRASNASDTRTFKVKVKKKKLTVSFDTNASGLKVAKLADASEIYTNDNVAGKKPELTTKYSQSGTLSDPSTGLSAPNATGTWWAYAVLTNAATCNYCVDAKEQFTLNKIGVPYPTLSGSASEVYNGDEQEFTYTGFDSDKMNAPAVPSGAISFDGETLKVKNVGSYTPVFTLKNPTLDEWSGSAPTAVTITPKPVLIVSDSANKTEWEKKTATSLTFNVTTPLYTGDSLNLVATYTLNGGAEQSVKSSDISVSGSTCTVTIGSGFAKGNYVLTVKVADGENYSGSVAHNFEITAQGLSLGNNDVKWNIAGKTFVTVDYENDGVYEMEYTGTALNLSNVRVDFSSASDAADLEQDGDLTGTFIGAKDVGEYTATFKIKAKGDYVCTDGPFTLTIKIVPKKLDFTKAEYEYSTDGGTTWSKITASDKPSYTGDPITVRLSPDYLSGLGLGEGDYTVSYTPLDDPTEQGEKTTNVGITINNSNYATADGGTFVEIPYSWEITARALNYTWDGTQAVTVQTESGEKTFEFPAVKFEDGKDYSKYYDYVYTVGGTEYTLDELKEYIAANWTVTTPVNGTVSVKMKDGVTEVNIKPGSRSFSTGTPKTALEAEVSGSGAEYGKVDFAFKVTKGTSDESARTSVSVTGGLLASARTFDGNSADLATFMNGLGVGKYVITVSLKAGQETSYVLTKTEFEFEVLTRKVAVPQVTEELTFNGGYINIAEYLDDNYNADIMSMLSGYTNKNAGAYTVTFKLASNNYEWVEPTSAEPASKKLFGKAVLFVDGIAIDNSALTATLNWKINKIVLGTDGWKFGKKEEGVSLAALADYQKMIEDNQLDIAIAYRYYDTNGNLIEEPVLKGGDKYIVEAYLTGADAANFEFEDGTDEIKSISARQDYTVPQSKIAAVWGSVTDFAKANWLWLVIAAAALLFLIILICIIAAAKKKKKRRLAEEKAERERKLAEEKEEKEREREERRLEREERMARMSQQQSMPQMMMPQMMPQMQMPQPQPQYAPQSQTVQPVMGGGSANEIAELRAEFKAEMAAMRTEATLRAEMAAKESAMRAEQSTAKELAELRSEQNAVLRSDVNALRNGEQVSGINLEAMTEMMAKALKSVLSAASQQVIEAKPAQPAQLTDGTTASAAPVAAQVPPDAVMTTVTTTKIDTTKKAQNGQGNAQTTRTTRSFVPPMPVDDGRV